MAAQRVLVLGGTRWIGRAVAAAHAARGAEVVCLARGEGGDLAPGTRLVAGDRDAADGYAGLVDEAAFDEVVDVTRVPAHAASALDALADRARHWTFVSSVSAQRLEGAPVGADEDDDLVPEDPSGEDYGGAKAWIERVLRERLGERLAIVRPGLVGGPGDESDRFGSWVARAAIAGHGPLLVPSRDQPTQTIDVRDLVRFLVEVAPGRSDLVNAFGPVVGLHALVEAARAVAGHAGPVVLADDAALDAAGIGHWAGPEGMGLRLPEELETHAQRSAARYLAAGGEHRSLDGMLRDALEDERARGLDRERRTGPSRAAELRAVASLASGA
ncbi:NAD-dependent epimerase/dehydratase family protein [Agrococcus sp. SL85]|uniref:NAD-dependent epimerase/dehydratase family protein n=1 Tax=Agrococcus sp. SL85 TaxID=2995141 RepID=UPI00226D1174|nr:NAD-dependent epimerase/dehydratase family protein [Agrococcus sp. SL85]WAC66230.1 NAD-dependent epimerase/dehydratase family protein [Agrococcus sp. SL85]